MYYTPSLYHRIFAFTLYIANIIILQIVARYIHLHGILLFNQAPYSPLAIELPWYAARSVLHDCA